jgi:predicted DNA-binding antitoxin AbrB/MazE fold protein
MSLLSVRGVYENGVVRLLSPVEVKGKFDLIVTFVEPAAEAGRKGGEESHDLEEQRRKILSFAGLLSDLTDRERQVMGEAMRRPLDMFAPSPEEAR